MSTFQQALTDIEFDCDLPDDQMIADVVLVARVVHRETFEELTYLASNKSISEVVRAGLIAIAPNFIEHQKRDDDGT